jgi:hypothetical protein
VCRGCRYPTIVAAGAGFARLSREWHRTGCWSTRSLRADRDIARRGLSDHWKQAKHAEPPLRRFEHASEVAPTAVLLASDPGGNLYVGQVLGPSSGDVMP